MALPLNKVVCGDNRVVMKTFPSDSVDLVVTSPPYWGLRDYGIGEKQLGLEPHPQQFIDNLVDIFREVKRIIKPTGSFWLNIGDTYYGSGKGAGVPPGQSKSVYIMPKSSVPKQKLRSNWLQPKQKMMIPARVAIALQSDGWILRNDLIWNKPNRMPESVKDRLAKSHEHVFFLVKSRNYHFDLDAIRIPSTTKENRPHGIVRDREYGYNSKMGTLTGRPNTGDNNKPPYSTNNPHRQRLINGQEAGHSKGKNPGDVWNVNTFPFTGAHFAVFPPKLITPIIKASCPKGGTVLDPFAGSGTTCFVARKLGRKFIGIELNEDYAEMARKRVRGETFKHNTDNIRKLTDL